MTKRIENGPMGRRCDRYENMGSSIHRRGEYLAKIGRKPYARNGLLLLFLYLIVIGLNSTMYLGTAHANTDPYFPSSATISTGSLVSGDMTSVVTVDTNYYIVRSASSATTPVSYNPGGYYPLPSTTYVSGAVSDLAINDNSLYMTFRSYASQTSTTSLSRAFIGYRSNTGTSTLSSPKTRSWSGSAWDGTETELSTAGSPVRWVRTAYSPLMARYHEKIIITLSDDGYLDAYVWTGSGWSVTNDIGFVGKPANSYRPFDIAYEKTSGKAMLVYGVNSTDTTKDLAYKIWDGSSWSVSESYIDDTDATHGSTNIQYYWVDLASKPTNGANEISLIALEGTTTQGSVRAWIWSGSSWGNELGLETDTTKDREDIGVAYESTSGNAMFVWGDDSVGRYDSRRWLASSSSWEGTERIVADWISGAPGQLTLKSDPASNRIMFLTVDSASDLWTAEWNGTAWIPDHGVQHDNAVDSATTRCADFDWEPSGSKGLMVWGTSSGSLSYKTYTASTSTWNGASTITATGTHPWVQLRRNPRDVSGDVKILGAMLNSNNDLGALKWDGTTLTRIGGIDSTFTADTIVTTYECFDLRFQVQGDPTEFTSEVEFTGSSNTYDWTQLVWTVDSAWTTADVTVTIQLYNYNSESYPSSGDGYDSYTSGAADTDETKTQTITTTPQNFRDLSGNWKIKIKGVKATSTQFDFKVDWIEYKPTYHSEYTASTEFNLSGMTGYTPTQLVFTVVSQYDVASVTTTIQVWDYSTGQYATSGEGYLAYTSSAIPSTDETKTLTITTNPSHYVSSGNAKIKITSVKTTTTQFQQKTNQIKLEYTYSPITKIVFTTAARTITAGEASDIITIQTQDASSNPVNVLSDTTITLSSTSGNGKFSLTSPWVDVTSVTITTGSNSVSFYYKDTTAGTPTPTITAAESPSQGWTDATQQETINPSVLASFTMTGYPTSTTAGVNFGSNDVTVTAKDAYGNVKTDYDGQVYFESTDAQAVLPCTSSSKYTFIAGDNGVHTFAGTGFTLKTAGSQTITVTDGAVSATSSLITVNPAALDRFTFATISSPQAAGSAFFITITAKDQYENTVTSYTGPNTLSDSTVTISPTSTGTFTSGVWTDSVTITSAQTGVTITTTRDGKSGTSNPFDVNPAGGSKLAITVYPSSITAGSWTTKYTVQRQDQYGNPVSSGSTTVNLASTSTGANKKFAETSGGPAVTFVTILDGSSTRDCYYYDEKAGTWAISVSATDLTGDSKPLTINPGGLASFTISGYPSSSTAGQDFDGNNIIVSAYDAYGNVKTDYTGQVYFTSTDTQAVLPYTSGIEYTFTTGSGQDNGVHTFLGTGFTLKTAGSQTITVTDGTVSATSASITVNPAALDHIVVSPDPETVTAGQTVTYTATAYDAYGNTWSVTGSTSWSIDSGAGGSWSANVYTSEKTGIWSVTGTYSDKSDSATLNINPAALDHFIFAVTTSPQTAGSAFSITITAKDAYENTVTSHTGPNTLSDSTGTINPITTGAFTSGVWTGSVTITKAQTGVTITTTGDGESGTSNDFDVNPASENKLVITVYPSSVTAGSWTTKYTVQRQDQYGNPVSSGSTTVDLASTSTGTNRFAETSGGSSITSVTILDGSSTRDCYYYDEKVGSWTISVSAAGLTGDSKPLTVNPGGLASFTMTSFPSPTTAGQNFDSNDVTVTAKDAYGNVKTDYTGQVYFTSTDSQAILPYTSSSKYTFTTGGGGDNGVHTFAGTGFTLKTAGSQTITVTDGTVSATSSLITVNPAGLAHFTFATISSPQAAGTSFFITITAKDAYENTVTSHTGPNTLSDSTGTINPITTGAFTSGVWTGSVTITKAQTGVTITTTGDGESGTSNLFDVNISVETKTGTGQATFSPDTGALADLQAVDESTLPTTGKPSGVFPHGFFSFSITGLAAGQSVVVTLTLPSDLPTNASYWKYQSVGWVQIPMGSNDGDNIITITLVDGGLGDDDGTADGIIVDDGAPIIPIKYQLTIQAFPSNGGTTSPAVGSYWHDMGSSVTVTETPGNGFQFDHWDLDGSNKDSDPSYAVGMNAPHYLTAIFQSNRHVIIVHPSSVTAGSWTSKYTVQRQDQSGNPVTSGSTTIYLASTSTGTNKKFAETSGGAPVTSVTIPDGVSTKDFYYYDELAGTWTITVIDGSIGDGKPLTVNPASLDHFTFSAISSPKAAGSTLGVTITAKDAYENTVTGYNGTNTLSDSTGTISPTVTGAFTSGSWTGNVTVTKAELWVTITTAGSGKSGESDPFYVKPAGGLRKIVFTTPPQTLTAGVASAVMTVQIQDNYGNPVKVDSDTKITLTSTSTAGRFSLSPSPWRDINTVTIVAKTSSASFYYNDTSAGRPTITAAENPDQDLIDATQQETINPSTLAYFAFDPIGGPQTVNTSFTTTIMARDQYGNTVTRYTGLNTLGDSTGTINPASTGAFTSGSWTGGVTITKARAGVTITTSGTEKSGASNPFWVAPFPDFAIYISPITPSFPTVLQVVRNDSGTVMLQIVSIANFQGDVALTLQNIPTGVAYAFENPTVAPLANGYVFTPLTIQTIPSANTGDYTLTVSGSGGDKNHTTSFVLRIVAAQSYGKCIIATATYGSEFSPQVQFLRDFRDRYVLSTVAGREFMNVFNLWYYSFSPQIASWIVSNPSVEEPIKLLLLPLLGILQLSEISYTPLTFAPEAAVTVAGIVASFLIGMVYFGPILAVVYLKGARKACQRLLTWTTLIWGISLFLLSIGIASTPQLVMLASSILVLSTMTFGACSIPLMVSGILDSGWKRKIPVCRDSIDDLLTTDLEENPLTLISSSLDRRDSPARSTGKSPYLSTHI